MWTVASWVAVGLVLALAGGLLLSAEVPEAFVWPVLIAAAIVTQTGVIAAGVLVGLRADRIR